MSSDPSVSPQHDHKPDIRKANICPPLPQNSNGLDKLVYWLGIGLGSGLPKRAPGTWGTLAGFLIGIPLMMLGFIPFLTITIIASVVGIWICDRTSILMDVHDDPHIVWDEWAGMWITMLPLSYIGLGQLTHIDEVPLDWIVLITSFLAFRFFDIVKPYPIGWIDSKVKGGLGIMLDDVIAAAMAILLMAIASFIAVTILF